MYNSLFEWETHPHDATLIANLIDQAVQQSQFNFQMAVQFMKRGCFIVLSFGKGHDANWHLNWSIDNPNEIDTGLGQILSVADPSFLEQLINQINKIGILMTEFCTCAGCVEVTRNSRGSLADTIRLSS